MFYRSRGRPSTRTASTGAWLSVPAASRPGSRSPAQSLTGSGPKTTPRSQTACERSCACGPKAAWKGYGHSSKGYETSESTRWRRPFGATADGLQPARRLIILPSRDLVGIPVEALLANDDTRRVTYAPSATVLKRLRERPQADRPTALLAVGAPIYVPIDAPSESPLPDRGLLVKTVEPGASAAAETRGMKPGDVILSFNGTNLHKLDDLNHVAQRGSGATVERWRNGKVDRLELGPETPSVTFDQRPAAVVMLEQRKQRRALAMARSGDERFGPLPHSEHEVKAIAELFQTPGRPNRILLGPDASEQELHRLAVSGDLAKFGVIHLATHARIDDGIPARSAVILAQTGSPDPLQQARNGRLSVNEIQHGWDLNAELVTLSACETALGRDSGGEGFVGFTQALLIAGARSVCLSLWKVNDLATSLLMRRFYQNWRGKTPGLDKPLSKAEALREAQRWLRELTDENIDHELEQIARVPGPSAQTGESSGSTPV